MSADVMTALATRWGCSLDEVRERIGQMLKVAGLIPPEAESQSWDGTPVKVLLRIGVTDDDRFAVIDRDGEILLWLTGDDEPVH